MRTIERFTRVSADEIDFSMKVEDPARATLWCGITSKRRVMNALTQK
jgi:hypothetical protein